MSKYNPKEIDLSKGKMSERAGYNKGVFITDFAKISDIILNGGQIELRAQEVREVKGQDVQVIECRIYYIPPADVVAP